MDNILPRRSAKLTWLIICAVITTSICTLILPFPAQAESSLPKEKAVEYQRYLDNGNKYLEKGNYREAIAEFNRALLLHPASAEAKKGIIKANQEIAARSTVPDAAAIEMDRLNFHLSKGTEYFDAEKYDEAIAEWKEALLIDPENELAHSLIDAAKRAKVDLLIEKGHNEFLAGRYKEAIAIWEEAREIVPESKVLRDLLVSAEETLHKQNMEKIEDRYKSEEHQMSEMVRERGLLPEGASADGIIYKDISEKPKPQEIKGFGTRQAILKELAQPVAFEFDCEPLRDVLAFLTTITGINILVDEEIFEKFGEKEDCYGTAVDRKEIFITIHVNDLPLESALNGMFRQHGLGFSIERDFIYISTPDVLRGSSFEQLETRFYHIRDTSRVVLPKVEGSGSSGGRTGLGGEELNLASGATIISRAKEVQNRKLQELDSDFFSLSMPKLVHILRTFVPVVLDPTKTTKTRTAAKIAKDKVYDEFKKSNDPLKLFSYSRTRWADSSDREILSLIDFDSHTNTLVARNTPTNLEILEVFLDQLDQEPRQIAVEARFLSYSLLEAEKVGIDWESSPITRGTGWLVGGSQVDFSLASNVNEEVISPVLGDRGGEVVFKFSKDDGEFLQLTFDLLSELKSTQTISAPRLVTLSNKPAMIQNITTRSFRSNFELTTTTTVTSEGTTTAVGFNQTITDVTEGITLSITPQIQADNTIRLFILPDIANITGTDSFDFETTNPDGSTVQIGQSVPQIARQSLFTNVVVDDGDTIVLGGFINDTYSHQKTGIPFLKDIPLIGRAFENEAKISDKLNLLIFVTVNIMDPRGVAYSRLK